MALTIPPGLKAPMVDYAIATAKRGLAVVALHYPIIDPGGVTCSCGREDCAKSAGKHPLRGSWQQAGTKDVRLIQEAWRGRPLANIGIPTGSKYGVVVLDADGEEGGASLSALEEQLGALPLTPTSLTGSGGEHRFFAHSGPHLRNSAKRLGPSLDVRGEGGQAVAPPSLHRSGRRYRWKVSPVDAPLAPLPQLWVEAILVLEEPKRSKESGRAHAVGREALHSWAATFKTQTTMEEARAVLWRLVHHPLIIWMCEQPDEVPREVWRGVAVNVHAAIAGHTELLELGRDVFHRISEDYERFSPAEASRVFDDALKSLMTHGPMRFSTMVAAGAPEAVCTGGTALIDAARRLKL